MCFGLASCTIPSWKLIIVILAEFIVLYKYYMVMWSLGCYCSGDHAGLNRKMSWTGFLFSKLIIFPKLRYWFCALLFFTFFFPGIHISFYFYSLFRFSFYWNSTWVLWLVVFSLHHNYLGPYNDSSGVSPVHLCLLGWHSKYSSDSGFFRYFCVTFNCDWMKV